MELKDVILSTLAEIEEIGSPFESSLPPETPKHEPVAPLPIQEILSEPLMSVRETAARTVRSDDEVRMLEGIRERLLVLFEGFQSPNNAQIEAKVDLTLNFLEYLLATIDNRLDTIKEESE